MMLFHPATSILGHACAATRAEESPRMYMAIETRRWTLEEMHALPEDGNKYELVHGELLVTPGPTYGHEWISVRLRELLSGYVTTQRLGAVFTPRAVLRIGREVELEPDLQVRQPHPDPVGDWETAPTPILVVEVLSPSSRRYDLGVKRRVYIEEAAVDEYWVVDGKARTVTRCRPGVNDEVVRDAFTWHPKAASEPLTIRLDVILP